MSIDKKLQTFALENKVLAKIYTNKVNNQVLPSLKKNYMILLQV